MLHGKTLILAISTGVNVLITFILVPIIGAVGAVIGTAFSMLFGYGIALNIYYQKRVGLKMWTYYKETYKGILFAISLALSAGFLVTTFLTLGGWLGFMIKAGIYGVLYCIAILAIGLNKAEKKKVFSLFKKFKRKKASV